MKWYIKSIICKDIEPGNSVIFHLENEIEEVKYVSGTINHSGRGGYYITAYELDWRELGIIDEKNYISRIVGYNCVGIWPEVKSIEDLEKVLKYLRKEFALPCKRKEVGHTTIKVNSKNKIKFNFKI